MSNDEFFRFTFKLVLARCPSVAGLESGFVFHYARSHSLRSAFNFMVSEKLKLINLRGMLNSRYIYNKQITT